MRTAKKMMMMSDIPLLPETVQWGAAVAASGGVVSRSSLVIADRQARALKQAGLWDSVLVLDTCQGNTMNSSLVRYKVPSGVSRSYTNNNFVAGDYSERGSSGGRKGNGATKYLNSLLNPSALGWDVSSLMLWAYYREVESGGSRVMIGAEDSSSTNITQLGWLNSGTAEVGRVAGAAADGFAGGGPSMTGFMGGGVNGSRLNTLYLNGAVFGITFTATNVFANRNLFCHANDQVGTPTLFSTRRTSQILITTGLSPAQVVVLNSIVQATETSLGRNV